MMTQKLSDASYDGSNISFFGFMIRFCFPVGITLYILAGLIDLVIIIGFKLTGRDLQAYIQAKIKAQECPFKKIDSAKLSPYALDKEIETLNENQIRSICHEIASDQLGRELSTSSWHDVNEKITVLKTLPLEDGSTLTIFRYRRSARRQGKGGKNSIGASVHMVRLVHNKICQSVEIENLASFDADTFKNLQDPVKFIEESMSAYLGSIIPKAPDTTSKSSTPNLEDEKHFQNLVGSLHKLME